MIGLATQRQNSAKHQLVGTKAERLEKFEIPAKIVFCLNVGRVWLVTKREKLKTKFQDDLKKLDH